MNQNKDYKKGKFFKKRNYSIRFFSILAIMLFIFSGVIYAASNVNSKRLYTEFLNNAAQKLREVAKMTSAPNTSSGVYSFEELHKKDGVVTDTEKYEIRLSDNKYYIKTDTYNLLWDKNIDSVYAKKLDGSNNVLSLNDVSKTWNLSYELDSLLSSITNYSINDEILRQSFNSNNDNAAYLNKYADVLEVLSKNLKDSYFIDRKANGLNEYVLSLNNTQYAELLENTVNDLSKKESNDLEDEDTEVFDLMEESIKEIKNNSSFKIEIIIYAKGNVKNICGVKLDMRGDRGTLFTIEGNFTVEGIVSDKEIKFIINSVYKEFSYSSDLNKYELKLNINSNDNKALLKSSDIVGVLTYKDNTGSHSIEVEIKGDSKKSFFDSTKIDLTMKLDGKKQDSSITLFTEDKKPLNKSSKISLKIEDIILTLEALDGKDMAKSTFVTVTYNESYTKEELIRISSIKDGKPIIDSNNVEILFGPSDEKISIAIKLLDKKGLKNIMKSTNFELTYVDEYNDTNLVFIIKLDKTYDKATKFDLKVNGILDRDNIQASVIIESLNKKPILNDSNIRNVIYILVDSGNGNCNEIRAYSDNTGFETYVNQNYNYSGKEEDTIIAKYEIKNSVDIDKLMDISNAKEATEKEIMLILNPGYKDWDELQDYWWNQ